MVKTFTKMLRLLSLPVCCLLLLVGFSNPTNLIAQCPTSATLFSGVNNVGSGDACSCGGMQVGTNCIAITVFPFMDEDGCFVTCEDYTLGVAQGSVVVNPATCERLEVGAANGLPIPPDLLPTEPTGSVDFIICKGADGNGSGNFGAIKVGSGCGDPVCCEEGQTCQTLSTTTGQIVTIAINPNTGMCEESTTLINCDDNDCTTEDMIDATCNCVNTPIAPPNCDDNDCNTVDSYDAANCICVNTPVAPPSCNTTPKCDGEGNITIEIYDAATCSCISIPVAEPTCNYGEKYSEEMCMCVPNTCYKVCDPTPYCDGNGWLIKKVLNPQTCECETQTLPAPTCGYGKVYDEASCQCVPKACNVTCSEAEWCENGRIFKDLLDPATCKCVKTEIRELDCDKGFIYDPHTCDCIPQTCTKICSDEVWCQYGRYYQDILDTEKCECVTEEVLKPACAYGEVFDSYSCKCVPKFCNVTCNGVEWCENGRTWKKVLDPSKCECVTKEVAKPNCAHGQVYDTHNCKCVAAPCTITCNGAEWCENGRIWKKVLDASKCECVTKEVTKQVCKTGQAYDAASCTCKPVSTKSSCDLVNIAANKGGITVTNLTAPIEIVKVFNSNWQIVYSCVANCKDTQVIPVGTGKYIVTVQLFTSSWKQICSKKENITVTGTTGTTTGSTGGSNSQSYQCGDVKVTYGDGAIHLAGTPGKQYFFKILKRFGNWQQVLNCTSSCGHEARLQNLQAGKYDIQIFNNNWVRPCATKTIDLRSNYFTSSSNSRTATPTIQLSTPDKQHAIYPNPAKQELFVDLNAYAGQRGMIRLVNQFGQVVQQLDYDEIPATTIRLDLQKAETGLHFLNIALDSNQTITEKVLINK